MSSSPFTQAVVAAVRNLYPENLADSSFDNTGLLLEAPSRNRHNRNTVLLTIDLTKGVADEAIRHKASIVIAYHPIIFRGLKSLTLANPQQKSLLRLAQEGISVYSPHTAVDAAPGGLNDWLADVVVGEHHVGGFDEEAAAHTRSVITPVKDAPSGFEGAGYGRIVRFEDPQKLGKLVDRITNGLGPLSGVSVATPQSVIPGEKADLEISSVGICAGSGGSMLGNLDVDLLFTGELSHHEALAAVENEKCVITTFHSNTERKFLKYVMKKQLEAEVAKVKEMMAEDEMRDDVRRELEGNFEVVVSEVDRDPYVIVPAGSKGW